MTAIPTPITLPGSKDGFISGDLGSTSSLSDFSHSINAAYSALVTKALRTMTSDVQLAAQRDADWAPFSRKIVAAYVDDEFIYTCIGSAKDESDMYELEFGSADTRPTGFLRKTMLSAVPTLQKMLQVDLV